MLEQRPRVPPRQTTTPGREFARISLQYSRADPGQKEERSGVRDWAWRGALVQSEALERTSFGDEHARLVAVAQHAVARDLRGEVWCEIWGDIWGEIWGEVAAAVVVVVEVVWWWWRWWW